MFENIQEKVLSQDQLQKIRAKYADKKIVFATGCYDILQSGHAVFFNQCKSYGDLLIVSVGKDETLRKLKFVDTFEIDFEFEYRNIKELNQI